MHVQLQSMLDLRRELEKAPPFRKAEAAGRLFDALLDYLRDLDDRTHRLEHAATSLRRDLET